MGGVGFASRIGYDLSTRSPREPDAPLNPSDFTLLVVDDNAENREILARRLERRGFQVMAAEDGQKALRAIQDEHVDLVLLDIMMPGISGIDVLKKVRETFNDKELPIIMATAKTDSEDVVAALDLGANDYVTKPIDFPVVLARVNAQLRNKTPRAKQATQAAAAAARELSFGDVGEGSILAERYRLGSVVGAGAFGAVYRATHLELDTPVAVKLLLSAVETGEEAVTRFRREGISACRVKHPNAVQVFDFGVAPNGTAYLVMEMLEGRSLQDELELYEATTPKRCAQLLLPVCDVLGMAHEQGIIHRDIKPSNIFISETPQGEVVKVLDFGIAKIAGSDAMAKSLTLAGTILGTPVFMAPERFQGLPYDGRSDVYSVGVMLYELLEGRLPFPSATDAMVVAMAHINDPPPPLSRCHPDVRLEMQGVLQAALEKHPDRRPDAPTLQKLLADAVQRLGDAADNGPEAGGGLDDLPSISRAIGDLRFPSGASTPAPTLVDHGDGEE